MANLQYTRTLSSNSSWHTTIKEAITMQNKLSSSQSNNQQEEYESSHHPSLNHPFFINKEKKGDGNLPHRFKDQNGWILGPKVGMTRASSSQEKEERLSSQSNL